MLISAKIMQACSCRVKHMSFLRMASKTISSSSRFQNSPCDIQSNLQKIGDIKLPDEPTTCCMSGCANCVWIQYAEELSKVLGAAGPRKAKEIIMNRVTDPNVRAYLLTELSILMNKNTVLMSKKTSN